MKIWLLFSAPMLAVMAAPTFADGMHTAHKQSGKAGARGLICVNERS